MMATVYERIKVGVESKPWIKAILNAALALLSFFKSKEVFDQESGPKIGPK